MQEACSQKKYNKQRKVFKNEAQRKKILREQGFKFVKDHKNRDCIAEEVGSELRQGKRVATKRQRCQEVSDDEAAKAKHAKLSDDQDQSHKVVSKEAMEDLEKDAESDDDDEGNSDCDGSDEDSEKTPLGSEDGFLSSSSGSGKAKKKKKGTAAKKRSAPPPKKKASPGKVKAAGIRTSSSAAKQPSDENASQALNLVERGTTILSNLAELTPLVMWKGMLSGANKMSAAVQFETDAGNFLDTTEGLDEKCRTEMHELLGKVKARTKDLNSFQAYMMWAKGTNAKDAVDEIKTDGSRNSAFRTLMPYLAEHLPMVLTYWGKRLLDISPALLLDFLQIDQPDSCAFNIALVKSWSPDKRTIVQLCTTQQNVTNELFVKLRGAGSEALAANIFTESWIQKLATGKFMKEETWYPAPGGFSNDFRPGQLPFTVSVGVDFQKVIACTIMKKADAKTAKKQVATDPQMDPQWTKHVSVSQLFSNTVNLCVSSSSELRCKGNIKGIVVFTQSILILFLVFSQGDPSSVTISSPRLSR